jgi:hypothetical protein
VSVTPAEPSECVVEVARYVIRCCRICGNVPARQVLKEEFSAPAVIVNDDGTVSLVCEKRSELIDQSRAVVWYKNLLAEVR